MLERFMKVFAMALLCTIIIVGFLLFAAPISAQTVGPLTELGRIQQLEEDVRKLQEQVSKKTEAKWGARGILTMQNRELNYFRTEYVEPDGRFDTEKDCYDHFRVVTSSNDYVGTGGTDGRVAEVQWNLDVLCGRFKD